MFPEQKKIGDHKWIWMENLSPEIVLNFCAKINRNIPGRLEAIISYHWLEWVKKNPQHAKHNIKKTKPKTKQKNSRIQFNLWMKEEAALDDLLSCWF